jgi:hypothetical protein
LGREDNSDAWVILNAPNNASTQYSNPVTLNASAYVESGAYLVNATLYDNSTGSWGARSTTTIGGTTTTTTTTTFDNSYLTGTYIWNMQFCDSDGDCGFSETNRTFTMDTSQPQFTETNLNTSTIYNIGDPIRLNTTITDTNLDTCWYEYDETNTTFTCTTGVLNEEDITTIASETDIRVWANDSLGNTNHSELLTFAYDTTAPSISVTAPVINVSTFTMPYNITFTSTASDLATPTCSYFTNENATPVIFTCNQTQNISFSIPGWYWIDYTANDTLGNENSTNVSYFIDYINYTATPVTSKIEGQNNTFKIRIATTNYDGASSVYLIWNNTNYTMVLNDTRYLAFGLPFYSRTWYYTIKDYIYYFTAPEVSADQNVTFNYSYNVAGTNYNTGNSFQTIYNIPSLNVTNESCSGLAYNFTLKDEANLSSIAGTFDYNFWYGTSSNSSAVRTYGTITESNLLYICINDTISNAWVLGSGEIFYWSTGYVDRRYYLFDNSILSNATTNITLYDLFSSDQTSFKLDVEDTSLNPYSNYFTTLVKWYPGLNEYNVVDMGKTDEKGTTIIHVKTEDVDYRIGVYYRNGTLVKLADPIRMACLTSPCTYTLSISPGDTDYTSIFGIEYTFDLNETTGIWTFVYSDPSLKTSTMNLTIYKDTGVERYVVCTTQTTGASGAMSCNTSAYTGTLIGQVIRSASPGQILVQKIGGIVNNVFTSSFGLWLSMLIAVPVIFFFAMMSPLGALIGVIVALIPALYFGSISVVIIGGIALLAGLVAHFIGRVGK